MYPARELAQLAVSREALMRRIYVERAACVVHAKNVARPLEWLNRAQGEIRKYSSWAGVIGGPIGMILLRVVTRKMGKFGTLLRWGPLAFSAIKSFMSKGTGAARTS